MESIVWTYDQPFELEAGGTLEKLNITYTTAGKLNERRDNIIWVCHALTANSRVDEWWPGLYGEGKLLDPEKYFIICANNIGSPYGTTSPNTIDPTTGDRYGLDFPFFTLRDTARAMQLLFESLELKEIALLIGGSCGGNIALEMSYALGDAVTKMALLCSAAKESPWNIGIHQAQRLSIEADPTFHESEQDAGKAGLKAARAQALLFYRSYASISITQAEDDVSKLDDFKASSYLNYQGEKLINRFDAHSYYHSLNALDTHQIGRSRGGIEQALSEIMIETLVISIDTDFLIPVAEQAVLAKYLPRSQHVIIASDNGHDGFLLEFDQIGEVIKQFLDN